MAEATVVAWPAAIYTVTRINHIQPGGALVCNHRHNDRATVKVTVSRSNVCNTV